MARAFIRLVQIPEEQIPFATPIPDRAHAVSCSFPALSDIVSYEKKDPETINRLKIAYPRFLTHYFVADWENHIQTKFGLEDKAVFCVCSNKSAKEIQRYAGFTKVKVIGDEAHAIVAVEKGAEAELKVRKFIQHTGVRISSREAEDLLFENGLINEVTSEEIFGGDAYEVVQDALTEKIYAYSNEDVHLANSGMSAIYAAFRALHEIQKRKGRTIWIQLGWLYVDTIQILNKFTGGEENRIMVQEADDLESLETILKEQGDKVAGIFSELPTNPILQTPDVEKLSALAREYEVGLVLDPTVSSIFNVDVLDFSDITTTSLTKYFSHEGDVMMGVLALNKKSPFYDELSKSVDLYLEPPYRRDVNRIAVQLGRVDEVVETINENTIELVRFLEGHSGVKKIFWAYSAVFADNYRKIEKDDHSPGCMITIEIEKPLAEFYDNCRISKGPSFGMLQTIMNPFMYMAHWDLVSTDEGREELLAHGLNPDLVRISVGTEPIADIIAAFDEAL